MSPHPFLFIVGCARSGTTLLRMMFHAHPEVAIPPESSFIPAFARRFGGVEPFPAGDFAQALSRHRNFRFWQLDRQTVEGAVTSVPDVAEALRVVYALYARAQGKPRYGDKTPRYVREINTLASMFPEARFIHIVRDGRDVVSSFLTTRVGPRTFGGGVRWWKRSVLDGIAAGRRLGPQRYTEVLYERLVERPEDELRRLCTFAELEYEPLMLTYPEQRKGKKEWVDHPHITKPPTPGLRQWHTEMPLGRVRRFEAMAGDALAMFGYEVSREPGLVERAGYSALEITTLPLDAARRAIVNRRLTA